MCHPSSIESAQHLHTWSSGTAQNGCHKWVSQLALNLLHKWLSGTYSCISKMWSYSNLSWWYLWIVKQTCYDNKENITWFTCTYPNWLSRRTVVVQWLLMWIGFWKSFTQISSSQQGSPAPPPDVYFHWFW